MSEENKALVRKFYEEVFNKGNVNAIDQLLDPKFVDHDPVPAEYQGAAGLKKIVAEMRNAFPDLTATIQEQVAERDTVVTHFTTTGTHKGPFMGAAATGKKITMHAVDIMRMKNGKVTDSWHYGDEMMAFAQIGIKPPG
ncbi:MAG: ester cyclase [Dehalococcoidia bacterium]|nr:ester cyclase [Dehalococcoidia bacterium]